MAEVLLEQDIKQFAQTLEKEGYVIIKNLIDSSTLEQLRNLTQQIIEFGEQVKEEPFQQYYLPHRTDQGALYDLFQRHPEFQDVAKNKVITSTIAELVGEDVMLYENSLVYKPKNRSNAVPWHQDFISRPNEPRKYIAWFALDKVMIENGAMKIVPGSHKLGFLPWYRVKGETHHDRLDTSKVELDKAIFAELEAGDVLIFNQLLVHGSEECHSDLPRRAYRVSYQGFDQIFTPRGTPIVVKGGNPKSLLERYGKGKYQHEKIPTWRRAVRYVGRRLAKF
jgi:phytanoyl-CoA hydroxylase